MRSESKELSIVQEDVSFFGTRQSHRVSDYSVEHWLKLSRGGRDYPQNVAAGGLLLQGFGELAFTILQLLGRLGELLVTILQLFERCFLSSKAPASCCRSSTIACACAATDVLSFGRRNFGLLFLGLFLVVLAIRELARRRNESMTESGDAVSNMLPWR